MMRRSGVRPAVKRWKLACEMLRRAASGHIEATQLSKFAAAWRIADAVISGWPEAPSSPLRGSGALAAAGGGVLCAGVACACASPLSNITAATIAVPVRLLANGPLRDVISGPPSPGISRVRQVLSRFPITQKAGFCCWKLKSIAHPTLFPAPNRLPTCDPTLARSKAPRQPHENPQSRLPGRRSRHPLSARHQGNAEGNADHRRQAADP